MNIALRLKTYLTDSVAEMKKVIWPTRRQTLNYTLLVIGLSAGMVVFFAALDYLFNLGLEFLI